MQGLFDFLEDDKYKLMIDMSKESFTENEEKDICERFKRIDKKMFYDICTEHEFDGIVGYCAKRLDCELPDYWEKDYSDNSIRQSFLKEKAKEICTKMFEVGIPMVILKNGGIMIDMIPEAVRCPMEDIDSLIKKEDFFKAHDVLVNNGFTFKFRSEFEANKLDEAYRHGSSEYYFIMPNGNQMWFELSWRAIDGRWIRPDLEPDTKGFFDRSYISPGTKVHILSPEDNLLQVCVHTAKHSYCRAPGLRLHKDVDRIVSNENINWNVFLDKVNSSHVRTSTYLSLYIPTVLFKTNIPEWVLDELKPKKAKRILKMLSKAGLLHPKKRKFTKLQFLLFQTSLYDDFFDVIHVLYPSSNWIKERYNANSYLEVFFYTIVRFFDLIGFRIKR